METVNGTICISYAELTSDIITSATLKALVRRGKIEQTRRGGNGRTALYSIESLPTNVQVKVFRKYGNPFTLSLGEIIIKSSDIAYYSCVVLCNGNQLPQEYIEKYAYECAVLSRCIELHKAKNVTWEMLADAVKSVGAEYNCRLPKSARVLCQKAQDYLNHGPASLISGKFGNSNALKS